MKTVALFCGHCGFADHRRCAGTCACADQGHMPDDELAARMRVYQRPDFAGDTVTNLAAEYRAARR